jgi:hypothetical protein
VVTDPVVTDDMLHTVLRRRAGGEFAESIRSDLIIPNGKLKGQNPSLASIYRALAEHEKHRHTPKPSSRLTPSSPPHRPTTERHSASPADQTADQPLSVGRMTSLMLLAASEARIGATASTRVFWL